MTPELLQALSQLGPFGIVAALILGGAWKLGDRLMTRLERTFDKHEEHLGGILRELGAHELRDVERHNVSLAAVKASEEHVLGAVQELATHVEVGLAEQRGRRDAIEDAPRGRNGSTTR